MHYISLVHFMNFKFFLYSMLPLEQKPFFFLYWSCCYSLLLPFFLFYSNSVMSHVIFCSEWGEDVFMKKKVIALCMEVVEVSDYAMKDARSFRFCNWETASLNRHFAVAVGYGQDSLACHRTTNKNTTF